MYSLDYKWKYFVRSLTSVGLLEIDDNVGSRPYGENRLPLAIFSSLDLQQLYINAPSRRPRVPSGCTFAELFSGLKRFDWQIPPNYRFSKGVAAILTHLPEGLTALNILHGVVSFDIFPKLPKSLIELSAIVKPSRGLDLENLVQSLASSCPRLQILALNSNDIGGRIKLEPKARLDFQKLFPSLVRLRLCADHWNIPDVGGWDNSEDTALKIMTITSQETLEKAISFPPNLESLRLSGLSTDLPSYVLDQLPQTLPALTVEGFGCVTDKNGKRDEKLKFMNCLPRSLTHLQLPHYMVDWNQLPPNLTQFIAESGRTVYLTEQKGNYENVFTLPSSLTRLEARCELAYPSQANLFPTRLTSLEMQVKGQWTDKHVASLFAHLPLLSNLILPTEISVTSSPKKGATEFVFGEHPRRCIFNGELEMSKRIVVKGWNFVTPLTLPKSITSVAFVVTPGDTFRITNKGAYIPPKLAQLPKLTRLDIDSSKILGGCREVLQRLRIESLKSLTYLRILSPIYQEPITFSYLPNGLRTLHLYLDSPPFLSRNEDEGSVVASLPSGLTDLKFIGKVCFKPCTVPHWPASLTRLEFPARRWSVVDALNLRKRLRNAKHIVFRSLLFSSEFLEELSTPSGAFVTCPAELDENSIRDHARKVLTDVVQFKLVKLDLTKTLLLPAHVRSLWIDQSAGHPFRGIPLQAVSSFIHLTSLTIISPHLSWTGLFDAKLPPSLLSLELHLTQSKPISTPLFDFVPAGLLHLKMMILDSIYQKDPDIFVAEPSSLPPLRTLCAPQLRLLPCDIECMTPSFSKLEFYGGQGWSDVLVLKLLHHLQGMSDSQSDSMDSNNHFEHLSLQCAALSGSLLSTEAVRLDWSLLTSLTEDALGGRVSVKQWHIMHHLEIQPSIAAIDLLIEKEPTYSEAQEIMAPPASSFLLHNAKKQSSRVPSLQSFAPSPPLLTSLKVSVQSLRVLHFSFLPPLLMRLCISYETFDITTERWSLLPRGLTELKIWNKRPVQAKCATSDRGIGLPPRLQVCHLSDFVFESTAIHHLPRSLTQLCTHENRELVALIEWKMSWVKFVPATTFAPDDSEEEEEEDEELYYSDSSDDYWL